MPAPDLGKVERPDVLAVGGQREGQRGADPCWPHGEPGPPGLDELLAVLDQGAAVLILDMTGTTFCASDGVHAVRRARQRAAIPAVLQLAASQ